MTEVRYDDQVLCGWCNEEIQPYEPRHIEYVEGFEYHWDECWDALLDDLDYWEGYGDA